MIASGKALIAGITAGVIALVQPTAGQPTTAGPKTVAAAVESTVAKDHGGYVLKDPGCGCPTPRPKRDPDSIARYPTRCLEENEFTPGKTYLPKNMQGTPYPTFFYPAGFPYTYGHGSNYLWLSGSATAGSMIPFPGWPAVKAVISKWDSTKRAQYIDTYTDADTNKGTPPGKTDQKHIVVDNDDEADGWEYWQIHHILERKHNAPDDHGNLVPAYSYPRSRATRLGQPDTHRELNQHSHYTKYWQQIRVDSQFVNSTATAGGIWDKIRGCDVVKWPIN